MSVDTLMIGMKTVVKTIRHMSRMTYSQWGFLLYWLLTIGYLAHQISLPEAQRSAPTWDSGEHRGSGARGE